MSIVTFGIGRGDDGSVVTYGYTRGRGGAVAQVIVDIISFSLGLCRSAFFRLER